MKACHLLLGCLALAACDATTQLETAGPVVVSFDQPFPANVPDLPGFLPRDCKAYAVHPDSSEEFLICAKALLIMRESWSDDYAGEWVDSMHLARRLGSSRAHDGMRYSVLHVGPGGSSYWVHAEAYDTLVSLRGPRAPRLRYSRGWYYLSTPALLDSTKWTVRRLAVANGRLTQQLFNPDSLRVRALAPTIVQQRRANGQLLITLSPQSRRAIGQVSSYGGLWLAMPVARPAVVQHEFNY
jgi:hypothetical protein